MSLAHRAESGVDDTAVRTGDLSAPATGSRTFGGVLLVALGGMYVLHATVALLNQQWPVWANRELVFLSLATWGWILLGLGVLVGLGGCAALTGTAAGRTIAMVAVAVAMVTSFGALPAYPLWSVAAIALNVVALFALASTGGDPAVTHRSTSRPER